MAKPYTQNRKASFDYQISEKFEAGISLTGHEVKAIKAGKMILDGAFVVVQDGSAQLLNAQIQPYQPNNTPEGYDPSRTRQLLLHKKEIAEIIKAKEGSNLTVIPVSVYNKGNKIKLEIGLAKRKKKIDKRDSIKKRDFERREKRIIR